MPSLAPLPHRGKPEIKAALDVVPDPDHTELVRRTILAAWHKIPFWPVPDPMLPVCAGAPATTIEALILDVRTRGLTAVGDRSRRDRIAQLTEHQLAEVRRRLDLRCPACREGVPQSIIDRLTLVWERTR